MSLPSPLAQDNEIGPLINRSNKLVLLIGNVLKASDFHKKSHVNSKGLNKDFSIPLATSEENYTVLCITKLYCLLEVTIEIKKKEKK